MSKITVKELQALTANDHGKWISLGNSIYGKVRAGKNDQISLYVEWRYKSSGKQRAYSIGTWQDNNQLSLKRIREIRDSLSTELKSGIDPCERRATEKLRVKANQLEQYTQELERIEKSAELKARLNVRGLFEHWQSTELRRRSDKGAETQRAFERDVFELIGDIAIESVSKSHIQQIVDNMMVRNIPRMTKKVLSDLRQMFNFALDRDLVAVNPTARFKKSSLGKDHERERSLSEKELICFFEKLPASSLTDSSQLALKLQLSTLTRIGEVTSARWQDIDFERNEWTLPVTKNRRQHKIFLSNYSISLLRELEKTSGASEWLFPNRMFDGCLNSKTITKQVADRQKTTAPYKGRSKATNALLLEGGQWRPHDLRRTGATKMAELGIRPDIIEKCLNHTEQNRMKRIYQVAAYENEMRAAWSLWGNRLELLTSPQQNVVLFKKA